MSCSIYVGNLPYSASSESLEEIFGAYGSVVSAKVITDRETQRSKGFGFVEMSTAEEADKAVKELENAEVDGRKIRVNLALPKEGGNQRNNRRDNYRQNYR